MSQEAYDPKHVLVREPQAMEIVGLQRTAFDELAKQPDFPAWVRVTGRVRGWYLDELHQWAEQRRRPKAEEVAP